MPCRANRSNIQGSSGDGFAGRHPDFQVADRLYPMIEVGQTYLISRGQLKVAKLAIVAVCTWLFCILVHAQVANKKFSTLNNSYEITLTFETQLQLCADELATKPKVHYRFVPIGDIALRPKDSVVDIIGVVSNISAPTSLTSKAGKELIKRTLTLSDNSGKAIDCTLWGEKVWPSATRDAPCGLHHLCVLDAESTVFPSEDSRSCFPCYQ